MFPLDGTVVVIYFTAIVQGHRESLDIFKESFIQITTSGKKEF